MKINSKKSSILAKFVFIALLTVSLSVSACLFSANEAFACVEKNGPCSEQGPANKGPKPGPENKGPKPGPANKGPKNGPAKPGPKNGPKPGPANKGPKDGPKAGPAKGGPKCDHDKDEHKKPDPKKCSCKDDSKKCPGKSNSSKHCPKVGSKVDDNDVKEITLKKSDFDDETWSKLLWWYINHNNSNFDKNQYDFDFDAWFNNFDWDNYIAEHCSDCGDQSNECDYGDLESYRKRTDVEITIKIVTTTTEEWVYKTVRYE